VIGVKQPVRSDCAQQAGLQAGAIRIDHGASRLRGPFGCRLDNRVKTRGRLWSQAERMDKLGLQFTEAEWEFCAEPGETSWGCW